MDSQAMELIEVLYNMIAEARGIPMSNDKCVLDRDSALHVLDDLKAQLPLEMSEARRLVGARDEFVEAAKQEADSIRRAAEEKAQELVQKEAVYQAALRQGQDILQTAEEKSMDVRRAASGFLDDALRVTEEAIAASLENVRSVRSQFRTVTVVPDNTGTADVSLSDVEESVDL